MTIEVTQSKACPEKFFNLKVTLDSGFTSEWDWMSAKMNTQETIDNYVAQVKVNERRSIHGNCHDEPCAECKQRIENAISSPLFAYARFRNYGTTIYHLDSKSPTGVSSASGCGNDKVIDELLKSKKA